MNTELLDIQPQELQFTFELKKQSLCPVQLFNKSNSTVAFKVKTTNPKKYCVRPNTGIIKPKSKCDFMVTMQAPRSVPPEMLCKDKFLVQSTVVPIGTTDEDITSSTFAKNDDKYVEEKKLKVILVSPPNSPVLSPINRTLHQVPPQEASLLEDQFQSRDEKLSSRHMVNEDAEESKVENYNRLDPANGVEVKTAKDVEELKLVKDIKEMKSKLNELELKLSEAEVTISKLTDERRLSAQERETLRQELALLRSKRVVKRVQVGFPLLFVCMVAIISVMFGYLLSQ